MKLFRNHESASKLVIDIELVFYSCMIKVNSLYFCYTLLLKLRQNKNVLDATMKLCHNHESASKLVSESKLYIAFA